MPRKDTNIFGEAQVVEINELEGKVFIKCPACMSVWSEGLSWANSNKDRIVKKPNEADNIIILCCQVTDLAVENDFRTIQYYIDRYPEAKVFASACLARRYDIKLPIGARRLLMFSEDLGVIDDTSLVSMTKPFWVKDFKEGEDEYKDGHLFRHMFPMRISRGCKNSCSYCTIRITRGDYCKRAYNLAEFMDNDNILLVSDSPTVEELKFWIEEAIECGKTISVRNVEPYAAIALWRELTEIATLGLLKVFHSPIQSNNADILEDMNRPVKATFNVIKLAKMLKSLGVFIATNIIIDYKDFKEDYAEIYKIYDYVSWNPYWDGNWDREKAEERFNHYFGE